MAATIRLATEQDAEQLVTIYTPYVYESPATFELEPPTISAMQARISSTMVSYPWLICEIPTTGEIAGYAYASAHNPRSAYNWSVNVSIYLNSKHHRCGIGTALYKSLFSCLRQQGYRNACAGITLPNAGSIGLHESMGFELVGVYNEIGYKFGKWHDVGWWQMALQNRVQDPIAPLNLSEAITEPGWAVAIASGLERLRI